MSNLPPGVSEGDIPGNRPEDMEWERLLEEIVYSSQTAYEARERWEEALDADRDREGEVVREFIKSVSVVSDDKRMNWLDVQIGREEWRELLEWFAEEEEMVKDSINRHAGCETELQSAVVALADKDRENERLRHALISIRGGRWFVPSSITGTPPEVCDLITKALTGEEE